MLENIRERDSRRIRLSTSLLILQQFWAYYGGDRHGSIATTLERRLWLVFELAQLFAPTPMLTEMKALFIGLESWDQSQGSELGILAAGCYKSIYPLFLLLALKRWEELYRFTYRANFSSSTAASTQPKYRSTSLILSSGFIDEASLVVLHCEGAGYRIPLKSELKEGVHSVYLWHMAHGMISLAYSQP